jgi:hypothetical protein
MIRIGAFTVAAFLGVLMGVMVGLLLNGKTLKRSEGATRQKGFSIGLSLDSRAWNFPPTSSKAKLSILSAADARGFFCNPQRAAQYIYLDICGHRRMTVGDSEATLSLASPFSRPDSMSAFFLIAWPRFLHDRTCGNNEVLVQSVWMFFNFAHNRADKLRIT